MPFPQKQEKQASVNIAKNHLKATRKK